LQDKKIDGHSVPTCSNSSCNFKFYQSSKPTVGAIIVSDKGQILLSVRSIEPQKGKIDIIGGFLENGEDPIEGLKREIREELGVEIKVIKIIGIFIDKYMYDKRLDDIYTFNVFYEAKIVSGKPKPADDISEAIWVDKNTVPWDKLAFKNTKWVLKKYFEIE
jgi:ADP-ribose pyrophosphatase YjhB (NUDIX family)